MGGVRREGVVAWMTETWFYGGKRERERFCVREMGDDAA